MKIALNVALKKYVMCVKIICYFKEMYAMILVKQEIILYLVIKVYLILILSMMTTVNNVCSNVKPVLMGNRVLLASYLTYFIKVHA